MLTAHTIKLDARKRERVFHTLGTLFCTAHLFLPLQALESLLNMLHPRSTINLSFLHLPFSCFFFFPSSAAAFPAHPPSPSLFPSLITPFLPPLLISSSPLLTQINLSPHRTSSPPPADLRNTQTYVCADSHSTPLTHTNTQPSRQQPQRPHINKSAPLLVLSVSGRGSMRGRGGGGGRVQRSPEGRRGEEEGR